MKTKNKRWLLKGVITALLVGAAVAPTISRERLKVNAAADDPQLVGPSEDIGWATPNAANQLTETGFETDIFEKTLTPADGTAQFQLLKNAGIWARVPASDYDRENSNLGYLIVTEPNLADENQNFYVLHSGEFTITLYNPQDSPTSPAGPRRFTINLTTTPLAGRSNIVLAGNALPGGWHTDTNPENRMEPIGDYGGRYLTKTTDFVVGGFKSFRWKTWEGEMGFSNVDLDNSTAREAIKEGSGNNIDVETAGNYLVVIDMKIGKMYFHTGTTTHAMVSKYYGSTLLEKEAAWSGVNYVPSKVATQVGKRLEGWYTDAALTTKYVPDNVTSAMDLYAKFVDNVDTKLTVFDRGEVFAQGGDVYAYGWNNNGAQQLGEWPGTLMTKHGYGYYSLDVLAANVTENILFHNNAGAQTPDLVWEVGKNLYGHDGENYVWGVMSAVHHEATLFAIRIFHETRLCDATGAANNVPADKWTELAGEFNALTTEVKAELKNAVANVNGDLVAQAVARYDYVVQKYGVATFANFMDRVVAPAPARQPIVVGEHRTMLVAGSFGIMAFVALAGFTILAKKRRNK
jgi:hypothetical protein